MQSSFTDDPPRGPMARATIRVLSCATGSCLSVHPRIRDVHSILAALGRAEAPDGLHERIMNACHSAEPVEEIACGECLELASAYLDDELHGAEREAFEAHVFACDRCYVAFKHMERTAEALRSAPATVAPGGLHERIMGAVTREAAAEVQPVFTWRRAAAVLGGLAAAAALLAAVFVPRGNDAPPAGDALAELPQQPAVEAIADGRPAEEPAIAEAPAPAAERPATVVAPATPTERAPRASSGGRVTPAPAVADRGADAPAHDGPSAPAVAPEPAPQPAPRPAPAEAQSERTPQPRRADTEMRAPERRAPTPEPEREPVTAESRPAPAPARGGEPEVASPPPARQPGPRETAIAAVPRAPEPERVPAPATQPAPAAAGSGTSAERAPAPGSDGESARLTVVPRQAPSRTVWRAEATPPSDRLTRMAQNINGSVNPRMDNPPSGIELN